MDTPRLLRFYLTDADDQIMKSLGTMIARPGPSQMKRVGLLEEADIIICDHPNEPIRFIESIGKGKTVVLVLQKPLEDWKGKHTIPEGTIVVDNKKIMAEMARVKGIVLEKFGHAATAEPPVEPKAAVEKTATPEPPTTPLPGRLRILVVDAYMPNVSSAFETFSDHDLRVVSDAESAREMLGSNRFDVVLTELQLPEDKNDDGWGKNFGYSIMLIAATNGASAVVIYADLEHNLDLFLAGARFQVDECIVNILDAKGSGRNKDWRMALETALKK